MKKVRVDGVYDVIFFYFCGGVGGDNGVVVVVVGGGGGDRDSIDYCYNNDTVN